ncbi:site-2 protease family protein [Chitinimonas lacunae]|uniref:Site-2 protease family protein n=1 Tax=Chitinimonas lacunae TaxID=1963018 RepID=A0ABV8MLQ4_9NEIS
MQEILEVITLYTLPVIFALTFTQAAQAMVADRLGDTTARSMGRLTWNPSAHIDPLGTILLPLGMIALAKLSGGMVPPILIGWAKPIPTDYRMLRNPRRDMRWIAAAVPLTNLAMVLFWAVLFKLGAWNPDSYVAEPLQRMSLIGVVLNASFAVLMCLPILPFPGGMITLSLLPPRLAERYARHQPWGMLILVVLFLTGILGFVMLPFIHALLAVVFLLFGIAP